MRCPETPHKTCLTPGERRLLAALSTQVPRSRKELREKTGYSMRYLTDLTGSLYRDGYLSRVYPDSWLLLRSRHLG